MNNKIDYLIIKSKKTFIKRNEDGQAYANEEGILIRENKEVFYLKRNGKFVKDPNEMTNVTMITLFLGGLFGALVCGVMSYELKMSFLLIYIPTILALVIGLVLFFKYSNECLLYLMSKEKADEYISTKERINENGIDGEVVERRKILEK